MHAPDWTHTRSWVSKWVQYFKDHQLHLTIPRFGQFCDTLGDMIVKTEHFCQLSHRCYSQGYFIVIISQLRGIHLSPPFSWRYSKPQVSVSWSKEPKRARNWSPLSCTHSLLGLLLDSWKGALCHYNAWMSLFHHNLGSYGVFCNNVANTVIILTWFSKVRRMLRIFCFNSFEF